MDNDIKREIIIENFQHPLNKEKVDNKDYKTYKSKNPNCIDDIDVSFLINNNIIEDIKFTGEACAISTASTSIMIKNIIGKSIEDAKEYIKNFTNMCNEQDYNEELLQEGIVFNDIYKQSNRIHCALLPYRALEKAIEDLEKK